MGNPSVTRDRIVLLLVNGMSAEAAEVFAIQSGAEVEGGAISFRRLVQLVQGREKGREKVSAEKRCQDDFMAAGKSSRHLFRSDIFPLSTARGDLLVVMI